MTGTGAVDVLLAKLDAVGLLIGALLLALLEGTVPISGIADEASCEELPPAWHATDKTPKSRITTP